MISKQPDKDRTKQLYALAFAATEFGMMSAGGALLGSWVDQRAGWAPLFTFMGLAGGFVVGLALLINIAKKAK